MASVAGIDLDAEQLIILVVTIALISLYSTGQDPSTNKLLVLPAMLIAIPFALVSMFARMNALLGIGALVLLFYLLRDKYAHPLAGLAIFAFVLLMLL